MAPRIDGFTKTSRTSVLQRRNLSILTARHCNLSGLLSVLWAGDQPVSIQFGLRAGGILAGWFTAYNHEFASYSPGLIQLRMMAETLSEMGIDTLQMGTGAKHSARAFRTRDIEVGAGTVTTGSVLGHTHRLLGGVSERALDTVRGHPALHHAADQLLRRSGVSSRFYGKV